VFKHGRSFNTQVYLPLYLFILRVQIKISAIHLKLLISGDLNNGIMDKYTVTKSDRKAFGTPIALPQHQYRFINLAI